MTKPVYVNEKRDESQESCLKPIGDIARMIEACSFEDYMLLMVMLANADVIATPDPRFTLEIGFND